MPKTKKTSVDKKIEKIEQNINDLTEIVSKVVEKPKEEDSERVVREIKEEEREMRNQMVSPQINRLVDTILGPEFERKISFGKTGQPMLKITVPEEVSNMAEDEKETYKIDKRTIVLTDGINSAEEGLNRIKANLKKPKKIN